MGASPTAQHQRRVQPPVADKQVSRRRTCHRSHIHTPATRSDCVRTVCVRSQRGVFSSRWRLSLLRWLVVVVALSWQAGFPIPGCASLTAPALRLLWRAGVRSRSPIRQLRDGCEFAVVGRVNGKSFNIVLAIVTCIGRAARRSQCSCGWFHFKHCGSAQFSCGRGRSAQFGCGRGGSLPFDPLRRVCWLGRGRRHGHGWERFTCEIKDLSVENGEYGDV